MSWTAAAMAAQRRRRPGPASRPSGISLFRNSQARTVGMTIIRMGNQLASTLPMSLPSLFLLGVIYYEELFLKLYCFRSLTAEGGILCI